MYKEDLLNLSLLVIFFVILWVIRLQRRRLFLGNPVIFKIFSGGYLGIIGVVFLFLMSVQSETYFGLQMLSIVIAFHFGQLISVTALTVVYLFYSVFIQEGNSVELLVLTVLTAFLTQYVMKKVKKFWSKWFINITLVNIITITHFIVYSKMETSWALSLYFLFFESIGLFIAVIFWLLYYFFKKEEELIESEQQYRFLVENAHNYIIKFDVDQYILEAPFKQKFSKDHEGLYSLNQLIEEGIFPSDFERIFEDAVEKGTVQRFECLLGFDDVERPYDVTLSPIFDLNNAVSGVISAFRDISENRKRQSEIESEKIQSVFVAKMSHEFRTPLNGIIGLTELLYERENDQNKKEYLSKILVSSYSLLNMLNDVLSFSKIDSKNTEIVKTPFNLHQLVESVGNLLSVLLEKSEIKFIIETSADIPDSIIGDDVHLEKVLINLIGNAIKFTERGYIFVQIVPVSFEIEKIIIEFQVQDTGIGFEQDLAETIFDPFYQGETSLRHKFGGTGLGLPNSKFFIEHMGGKISVKSSPNKGTTFSFTIPFAVDAHKQVVKKRSLSYANRTVLVIEEVYKIRKSICDMIETMNFQVIGCKNFTDVDYSRKYDIVITEAYFDDNSWLKNWLNLKKKMNPNTFYFLICSTTVKDEWTSHSGMLHPDGFLLKPINRVQLLKEMEAVFNFQSGLKQDQFTNKNFPILLVEDNEINQLVAKESLESRGFEVTVAYHGKEALEILDQEEWGVILMDINMPEMDGVTTAKIIRSRPKYENIPIFALTAISAKDHQRYYEAGMDGVITKPLEINHLLAEINKVFNERKIKKNKKYDFSNIYGINVQELRKRLNNKDHIFVQMINLFLSDYSDLINPLKKNLEDQDFIGARKMMHTLKGVAGNMSALRLFEICSKLSVDFIDEVIDVGMIDELEKEINKICRSFQEFKNKNQNGE